MDHYEDNVLDVDYEEVTGLSILERELLVEYQKLAKNLAGKMSKLSSTPCGEILESLQTLESKTSLVFTLMQASVYNVFLQNEGDLIEGEKAPYDDVYMDDTQY